MGESRISRSAITHFLTAVVTLGLACQACVSDSSKETTSQSKTPAPRELRILPPEKVDFNWPPPPLEGEKNFFSLKNHQTKIKRGKC